MRNPSFSRLRRATAVSLLGTASLFAQSQGGPSSNVHFNRIAAFPVVLNNCQATPTEKACLDQSTVAEIVAASEDGRTLVYTDSTRKQVGFVDISDASAPKPAGLLAMDGEPTSVAVVFSYAIVAVNTSESFTSPSGVLRVIHLPSRTIVRDIAVGGQPDSITVSSNRRFAAIAVENERDESLCVGGTRDGEKVSSSVCRNGGGRLGNLPQSPGGFLAVLDIRGGPDAWRLRTIMLDGLATKFGDDPEVEFVDINQSNVAAVTLQENNHIVLVDLPSGRIVNHFSAGTADLDKVDIKEERVIGLTGELKAIPREPDAVAWISNNELATADEGDLDGGSRGFTVFSRQGAVLYAAGNSLEHTMVRYGHYPEDRAENKGNEPEGVKYGKFGAQEFLFVGSERSNTITVYRLRPNQDPEFMQVLPAGVGPEGLETIESRGLLVSASEVDARGDAVRSTITIYQLQEAPPEYPTVVSRNRADGTPIPWGALSGLAADPNDADKAYTIYDSFYKQSRIFPLDLSEKPARITGEIVLRDGSGNTVDLDLEGVAVREGGAGFWVVAEGAGDCTAFDACSAVTKPNLLVRVSNSGLIEQQVPLPADTNKRQKRFGFEGVASVGTGNDEAVYVAFQREWVGDPAGKVRIGRFANGAWSFYYYPLDAVTSPNGGWVGLSEITSLGGGAFVVVERDNQAGLEARVKRVYRFSVDGLTPQAEGGSYPTLTKTLVRDLIPDLRAPNGTILEKVEGLCVLANGQAIIVTDNDGLNNSNGETQLIGIGTIR